MYVYRSRHKNSRNIKFLFELLECTYISPTALRKVSTLKRVPLESPTRNVPYRNVSAFANAGEKWRRGREKEISSDLQDTSRTRISDPGNVRLRGARPNLGALRGPLGGQLFPRVAAVRSIEKQQDNSVWFIFMSTPAFNSCRSRSRSLHSPGRPRRRVDRGLVSRAYETSANSM